MIRYGNPYFTIILQWLPWHRCFSYIQHIWLFQRFVMAGVGGWISPLLLIWQEYLISSKKPSPGRTGVVDVMTNRIFNLDGWKHVSPTLRIIYGRRYVPYQDGGVMKALQSYEVTSLVNNKITNSMYNVGQFISFQLFGSLFADYFSAQLYPNSK